MESKEKFFIHDGCLVGQISVHGPVSDIMHHPCYETTPRSYIKQGRLWECACICGKVFLVSEFVLSRGLIKSCGCARYSGNKRKAQSREMQEWKLKKMKIEHKIQELQYELNLLKNVRLPNGTEPVAERNSIAERLRAAFAYKASLQAQYRKNKKKLASEPNED